MIPIPVPIPAKNGITTSRIPIQLAASSGVERFQGDGIFLQTQFSTTKLLGLEAVVRGQQKSGDLQLLRSKVGRSSELFWFFLPMFFASLFLVIRTLIGLQVLRIDTGSAIRPKNSCN